MMLKKRSFAEGPEMHMDQREKRAVEAAALQGSLKVVMAAARNLVVAKRLNLMVLETRMDSRAADRLR